MTGFSQIPQSAILRSLRLEKRRNIRADAAILSIWTIAVVLQAAHHVMWRDEVRALSIALAGDDVFAMLRGLHGEGHPAVWYLLLRGAHAVWQSVLVLPLVAGLIGLASAALLVIKSPFPRWLVILILGGHAFLYSYSVEARNYGIAALLLFVIAALYQKSRDRGALLGLLLFLLANTNIIATLMVGAFLLFWFLDILAATGLRWTPQLGHFGLNAALAMAGVAVCAVTILPTYNDAAAHDWSTGSPLSAALSAVFDPAAATPGRLVGPYFPSILGSLLMFGLALGLAARGPAAIAALAGLWLLSLFSSLAASGDYRHAAIWLCFCVALYWISWRDVSAPQSRPLARIAGDVGRVAFVAILGIQLMGSLLHLAIVSLTGIPAGRSADLAHLIGASPELAHAVVLSEPDYLIEPLPYYIPNRLYLMREHRFGNVLKFTRAGIRDVDLGGLLQTSRAIQAETGERVVILLAHRLQDLAPDTAYKEGYNWTFRASSAQIHEFLSSTDQIASYGPAEKDESYDVYVLRP
jgi:hypothetical protein